MVCCVCIHFTLRVIILCFEVDATFALSTLERELVHYVSNPAEKEFNLESVPVISKAQEEDERRRKYLY